MGYIRQGNNIIAWGRVTGDPRHRFFDSGKQVTNFGLSYDRKQENGEWKNQTIYVDAWGEPLAPYCSCLEKGDFVMVAGELKRDDYSSSKKNADVYKINAAVCFCQPTADYGDDGEYDAEAAEALKSGRQDRGGMKNYEKEYRGVYEDPGIVDLPGGSEDDLPDFLKD